MRVVFVGHACHLVEIDGLRILTDPWLTDPIFGAAVEHDPPLAFRLQDLGRIDAIALTHGHLDHFNAPTLAQLADKSIPVVHPPIRFTELDENLRRLGFTNLHARRDFEPLRIGTVRIVPTPSLGVPDECAWLIEGRSGRFWDGADAPQPPQVVGEIAARFGRIDLGAFSHNSFDQPALLHLPSFKEADHAPHGASAAAELLDVRAAFAAASNMRWCGARGEAVTRKVIRRRPAHFASALEARGLGARFVDLRPGDAWSREGAIERGVLCGTPAPRVANDYIHAFLGTGLRWSPSGEPSTEQSFRRDLPRLLAARPEASRYVAQPVFVEVVGDDPGAYTVDFRRPGEEPVKGDTGAPFAVRLPDRDWRALFERMLSWQTLLVSDRLEVTRVRRGAPPEGLHCVYALQAIFP
jgi:L-ascorbate metabolism protein UlaG (beta-lactamase superfamily)